MPKALLGLSLFRYDALKSRIWQILDGLDRLKRWKLHLDLADDDPPRMRKHRQDITNRLGPQELAAHGHPDLTVEIVWKGTFVQWIDEPPYRKNRI